VAAGTLCTVISPLLWRSVCTVVSRFRPRLSSCGNSSEA